MQPNKETLLKCTIPNKDITIPMPKIINLNIKSTIGEVNSIELDLQFNSAYDCVIFKENICKYHKRAKLILSNMEIIILNDLNMAVEIHTTYNTIRIIGIYRRVPLLKPNNFWNESSMDYLMRKYINDMSTSATYRERS